MQIRQLFFTHTNVPSSITPVSTFVCKSDSIRQSLLLTTLHDQVTNFLLIEKEKKKTAIHKPQKNTGTQSSCIENNKMNTNSNNVVERQPQPLDTAVPPVTNNDNDNINFDKNVNVQRSIPAVFLCQRWKMDQSPPQPISLESISQSRSNSTSVESLWSEYPNLNVNSSNEMDIDNNANPFTSKFFNNNAERSSFSHDVLSHIGMKYISSYEDILLYLSSVHSLPTSELPLIIGIDVDDMIWQGVLQLNRIKQSVKQDKEGRSKRHRKKANEKYEVEERYSRPPVKPSNQMSANDIDIDIDIDSEECAHMRETCGQMLFHLSSIFSSLLQHISNRTKQNCFGYLSIQPCPFSKKTELLPASMALLRNLANFNIFVKILDSRDFEKDADLPRSMVASNVNGTPEVEFEIESKVSPVLPDLLHAKVMFLSPLRHFVIPKESLLSPGLPNPSSFDKCLFISFPIHVQQKFQMSSSRNSLDKSNNVESNILEKNCQLNSAKTKYDENRFFQLNSVKDITLLKSLQQILISNYDRVTQLTNSKTVSSDEDQEDATTTDIGIPKAVKKSIVVDNKFAFCILKMH